MHGLGGRAALRTVRHLVAKTPRTLWVVIAALAHIGWSPLHTGVADIKVLLGLVP